MLCIDEAACSFELSTDRGRWSLLYACTAALRWLLHSRLKALSMTPCCSASMADSSMCGWLPGGAMQQRAQRLRHRDTPAITVTHQRWQSGKLRYVASMQPNTYQQRTPGFAAPRGSSYNEIAWESNRRQPPRQTNARNHGSIHRSRKVGTTPTRPRAAAAPGHETREVTSEGRRARVLQGSGRCTSCVNGRSWRQPARQCFAGQTRRLRTTRLAICQSITR